MTSSEKIVVGGKSALQNDELLKQVATYREPLQVMHTSSPGSPFSVILAPLETISPQDLYECAVFTACFSQTWKSGKKEAEVDLFSSSHLHKSKGMKAGMWAVSGEVKHLKVSLKLILTRQKKILRAVPEKTLKNKKDRLLTIVPGRSDKKDLFIKVALQDPLYTQEEFLAALPAGGSQILP